MEIPFVAANTCLNDLTTLIDTGGAGSIQIYTGSAPATPETSPTGTLLVTLTMSATSFPAAASGSMTANAITSGTAVATGTAGYARLINGAGTCVGLLTVGVSGTELTIPSTSITTGQTIGCTSFQLAFADTD